MQTEEGKDFTLVLEHTMDMKENPFHTGYCTHRNIDGKKV